jgi:Outer membrane protein beta-barrel domain
MRAIYAWAGFALAAGFISTSASGADNGIYLGASVGQSNVKVDDAGGFSGLNFSGDDTGYKFIVGFRAFNWFAVEASYIDFGKPDDRIGGVQTTAATHGVDAFVVGFLPIGPVDLFAKVGGISWNGKVDSESFGKLVDADGTDFAYGVGAQFRLGSLALRAEYEAFDASNFDTLDMISVGVTWTFF